MAAEYSFDRQGVFHTSNGARVAIDPQSSAYARFVTWACENSPDVHFKGYEKLHKGFKYFCDEASVIQHCKNHGITLFVEHTSTARLAVGDVVELTHNGDIEVAASIAEGRMVRFLAILAAEPDAGFQPPTDPRGGLGESKRPAFYVSQAILSSLNKRLQDEDSDIRRLSSWPVQKTFLYLDVSGFSQHPVGHQLRIINSLIELTNERTYWDNLEDVYNDRESSICIGDGYIFIFKTPHYAAFFAAYLATLIEHLIAVNELIEFHFRISVHTGPVYRFWDRGKDPAEHRWNYIGRGITEGQRVLEAMGKDKDDVVYLSAETRTRIRAETAKRNQRNWLYDATPWLHNRGRQKDDHQGMRRLFEVNHTRWVDSSNLSLPFQNHKK